jgi:hypothetical protein
MNTVKIEATGRTRSEVGGVRVEHKHFPAHHRMEWHDHEHDCLCLVAAGSMQEATSREYTCVAGGVVFKPGRTRHRNDFMDRRITYSQSRSARE